MEKNIKICSEAYKLAALQLVEKVFSDWDSPEESRLVRRLVEEIRSKKYYVPELEVKELAPGTLDNMRGMVDYSFYESLHEG